MSGLHRIDLEQARFGSQLEVTIDVAADALGVRLPPLLVQPLVENAIKHGLEPKAEGGRNTASAPGGYSMKKSRYGTRPSKTASANPW